MMFKKNIIITIIIIIIIIIMQLGQTIKLKQKFFR